MPGSIRPNDTNTKTILNAALNSHDLNDQNNLLPKQPTAPTTTPASPHQ